MTPQELMDLPFAGMAQDECVKAGNWDEDGGKEEVDWNVKVAFQYYEDGLEYITVTARSEEEACSKAEEEVENEYDAITNTVEILNVEEIK